MRYIHKLFLMNHRVQTVFRAWSQSNPLITANFKISQFAISQHLSEFRASSLVRSERAAVEQVYSLTAGPLAEVFNWVSAYRTLSDPSGHAWALVPAQSKPAHPNRKTGGDPHGEDGVIDAAAAAKFYERTLGAKVLYRSPSPSGQGEHRRGCRQCR